MGIKIDPDAFQIEQHIPFDVLFIAIKNNEKSKLSEDAEMLSTRVDCVTSKFHLIQIQTYAFRIGVTRNLIDHMVFNDILSIWDASHERHLGIASLIAPVIKFANFHM